MRTGHRFGATELPNHSGSTQTPCIPCSFQEVNIPTQVFTAHSPSSSTAGTSNGSDPDREGGTVVIACRTAMFAPNLEPHSSNASASSMLFHRSQPSPKSMISMRQEKHGIAPRNRKADDVSRRTQPVRHGKKKTATRRRRGGPPLKAGKASRPCRWGRCKTRPYPRNALA